MERLNAASSSGQEQANLDLLRSSGTSPETSFTRFFSSKKAPSSADQVASYEDFTSRRFTDKEIKVLHKQIEYTKKIAQDCLSSKPVHPEVRERLVAQVKNAATVERWLLKQEMEAARNQSPSRKQIMALQKNLMRWTEGVLLSHAQTIGPGIAAEVSVLEQMREQLGELAHQVEATSKDKAQIATLLADTDKRLEGAHNELLTHLVRVVKENPTVPGQLEALKTMVSAEAQSIRRRYGEASIEELTEELSRLRQMRIDLDHGREYPKVTARETEGLKEIDSKLESLQEEIASTMSNRVHWEEFNPQRQQELRSWMDTVMVRHGHEVQPDIAADVAYLEKKREQVAALLHSGKKPSSSLSRSAGLLSETEKRLEGAHDLLLIKLLKAMKEDPAVAGRADALKTMMTAEAKRVRETPRENIVEDLAVIRQMRTDLDQLIRHPRTTATQAEVLNHIDKQLADVQEDLSARLSDFYRWQEYDRQYEDLPQKLPEHAKELGRLTTALRQSPKTTFRPEEVQEGSKPEATVDIEIEGKQFQVPIDQWNRGGTYSFCLEGRVCKPQSQSYSSGEEERLKVMQAAYASTQEAMLRRLQEADVSDEVRHHLTPETFPVLFDQILKLCCLNGMVIFANIAFKAVTQPVINPEPPGEPLTLIATPQDQPDPREALNAFNMRFIDGGKKMVIEHVQTLKMSSSMERPENDPLNATQLPRCFGLKMTVEIDLTKPEFPISTASVRVTGPAATSNRIYEEEAPWALQVK